MNQPLLSAHELKNIVQMLHLTKSRNIGNPNCLLLLSHVTATTDLVVFLKKQLLHMRHSTSAPTTDVARPKTSSLRQYE